MSNTQFAPLLPTTLAQMLWSHHQEQEDVWFEVQADYHQRQAPRPYEAALEGWASGQMKFFGPVPRQARGNKKEHALTSFDALWADIDEMNPGQDLHALLDRLEPLTRLDLWPSAVCYSGRAGLHCYWKLEEALPMDQIERYNKELARLLGGDNCHERTRLLRIPGTINEKPGGGRVELLDLSAEIHPLDRLDVFQIDPLPQKGRVRSSLKHVPPPDLVPLTKGRDWGEIDVNPEVLMEIHTRYLELQPKRGWENKLYPSRSECEQAVLYRLIGAGASDRQLHAFADSCFAKHLECMARRPKAPRRYLSRSIASARSEYLKRTGLITSPEGGWPKVAEPKKVHIGLDGRERIVGLVTGQTRAELVRTIQEQFSISRSTAYRHIRTLLKAGRLIPEGRRIQLA